MKALVVDDDRVLADLLLFTLRREGFEVIQANDGDTALQRWNDYQPDIVILDVNLPETDTHLSGFSVCQKIRECGDTPIILLTVRADEEDILLGLKLGADDYVLKPFSTRQLVARVHTVLRRAGKTTLPAERQVGALRLDTSRHTVSTTDGRVIPLTPLEYRLLDYLMLNSGHILPFDDIILQLWGPSGGDRDMLRQIVRRLRAKIEPNPTHPKLIETFPALGYALNKP